MNNERQIKPLRKYTLSFPEYAGMESDIFTADGYVQDENSLIFYNAGNVVRQYFQLPAKMEVTPVDPAEVPF